MSSGYNSTLDYCLLTRRECGHQMSLMTTKKTLLKTKTSLKIHVISKANYIPITKVLLGTERTKSLQCKLSAYCLKKGGYFAGSGPNDWAHLQNNVPLG